MQTRAHHRWDHCKRRAIPFGRDHRLHQLGHIAAIFDVETHLRCCFLSGMRIAHRIILSFNLDLRILLGLDLSYSTCFSDLPRLLVNRRCKSVFLLLLANHTFPLCVLLALHLLHTLMVCAIKVSDIHLLTRSVHLAPSQLFLLPSFLLCQFCIALAPHFLQLLIALIERLLVSFVGEERRGSLL